MMQDATFANAYQSQNPVALECRQVRHKIGRREILRGVSFSIPAGHVAGLLGPNGAGKSTLLRILTGLVPPQQGIVEILGEKAGERTLKHVAFLPDRGKLPSWLTSAEWLSFAARIYPDWNAQRADMWLDLLAIKLQTRIASLSRGEEARLQLLTCLARNAPIVVLDEPFTGVDLISRERIASSIVTELADGERTFLIATHDIRETETLFDTIVFLGDGRVQSVEEVANMRERGQSVESRYREVFA